MFGKNKSSSGLPGSKQPQFATNDVLVRIAEDYVREQKWRRYLRVAFLVLAFLFVFSLFSSGQTAAVNSAKPHTALVDLNGAIGISGGVFADQINSSLRKAFEAKNSKAVVLRVNSPGGSPVQSDEIYSEMRRLRNLYPQKPLHVVVSDICASGGYYIAAAGDQIFANRSSLVGSIGVRMDSFGFVDALEKLGVERRSLTAGVNKAILDPFLPVQEDQRAHAQTMLDVVHQQFIEQVKAGRGDRLADDPDLFSGLFWSGEQAKELGLIDDYGSLDSVARDVIGYQDIVNYTHQLPLLEQLSRDLGVSITHGFSAILNDGLKLR